MLCLACGAEMHLVQVDRFCILENSLSYFRGSQLNRKNHPVPLIYGYEESHRSESWILYR
jgi:hypothetical protein